MNAFKSRSYDAFKRGSFGRAVGAADPLAGLALRLQSCTDEIVGTENGFYIFGDPPLGGQYRQIGSNVWVNGLSGYYFDMDGTDWFMRDDGSNIIATGSVQNQSTPADASPFSNGLSPTAETFDTYGILGLYQDTACTTPVTAAGQLVAGWKDELSNSGLVAIQSNSVKRPEMQYVNGRPVVVFDGVDDYLEITTTWSLASVLMTARFSSMRFPGGGFPFYKSFSVADNGADNGTWWCETGGSPTGFGSNGIWRTLRVENFPTSVESFNNLHTILSTPSLYQVWQKETSEGTYAADFNNGANLYIGCNAGLNPVFCMKGWISSIFLGDESFDRLTLEALALDLQPYTV